MAFKPNYRGQRAEKARSREAKQQEKLARREEASARRRALRESGTDTETAMPAAEETAKPSGE